MNMLYFLSSLYSSSTCLESRARPRLEAESLVHLEAVGLKNSQRSVCKEIVTRTVTPIAVTSAPAPAPWMINGRGEYL